MRTEALFVPERLYNRKQEIHARFGGQEQGGMITPSRHGLIFLVTGSSGRQHGYEDRWSEDGATFFYFGMGQSGDMKFEKGNLALRDHVVQGEDVHLFEDAPAKGGYVRYKGQMVCTGFSYVDAPDTEHKMRKAILFELVPLEAFETGSGTGEREPSSEEMKQEEEFKSSSLEELRRKAIADSAESRTPVERRGFQRMRSRAVRLYVLRRASGVCEGCGAQAPFLMADKEPYLEPHHIRRLSDGGPDNPRWVIGVCPNCHRRAHYSHDALEFNTRLAEIVEKLERGLV